MEPLRAIASASPMIGFVDFGFKVIPSARELSERPEDGAEAVESRLSDFQGSSDTLKAILSKITTAYGYPTGDGRGNTQHTAVGLYRACATTNQEFQELLGEIERCGSSRLNRLVHGTMKHRTGHR